MAVDVREACNNGSRNRKLKAPPPTCCRPLNYDLNDLPNRIAFLIDEFLVQIGRVAVLAPRVGAGVAAPHGGA